MSEELCLALFSGSIFALIGLYVAYLSLGTKMPFFVFHTFHIAIWAIMILGAVNYFLPLKMLVSNTFRIFMNRDISAPPWFIYMPVFSIILSYSVYQYKESLLLSFFFSIFSVAIPVGLTFMSVRILQKFSEHIGINVFYWIYLTGSVVASFLAFLVLTYILFLVEIYILDSD